MNRATRGAAVVGLLAGAWACVGCASFTSFQTASVLEPGEWEVEASAAAAAYGAIADVAVRTGLGGYFDVGAKAGVSGLIMGDVKFQIVTEGVTDDGGEIPLSAAISVGGGIGDLTNFGFGQIIVSKKMDWGEPYFTYRYQLIDPIIDLEEDTKDVDDLLDSILEEIVKEATDTPFEVHHFFLGARFDVGEGFFVTAEISFIAGDASGLGDIGVAIGYKW